jgi:hypothetical protein
LVLARSTPTSVVPPVRATTNVYALIWNPQD